MTPSEIVKSNQSNMTSEEIKNKDESNQIIDLTKLVHFTEDHIIYNDIIEKKPYYSRFNSPQ